MAPAKKLTKNATSLQNENRSVKKLKDNLNHKHGKRNTFIGKNTVSLGKISLTHFAWMDLCVGRTTWKSGLKEISDPH